MSFGAALRLVHKRLDDFQETGDPDVILCAAATGEADALLQAMRDAGDRQATAAGYHALGWLAYWRYNELPQGPDQPELALALTMLAPFAGTPEMVPESMRAVLGPDAVPATQSGLAVGLLQHAQAHDDQLVLDAAIDLMTAAVAAIPAGRPDRWEHVGRLAAALGIRFLRTAQLADVRRAIELGETALAETPKHERASGLYNLRGFYQARFEHTGEVADLERAITLGEQAVDATPPGHRDRLRFLSNLGQAYLSRFERLGDPEDLQHAVDTAAEAVAGTPENSPQRARMLSNLRSAYRARYLAGGDPADLERAIDLGEQAVAAVADDHPERVRYLSNLGVMYADRFERRGATPDLTRAIELNEQALRAAPRRHADRPSMLANLGNKYLDRFHRFGDPADLDRAIEVGEAAVAGAAESPTMRVSALTKLAAAYATRFSTAARTRLRPDTTDLDRAIELNEQVLAETPEDHPDRPHRAGILGWRYQSRFTARGTFDHLERAVDLHEEALAATPDEDPDLAAAAAGLARSYMSWANMVFRDDIGHDKVRSVAARVARAEAASPAARVHAGLVVGALALVVDDPSTAVEALDRAVALLPAVAPGELDRADQEHLLGNHFGLAAEAISAHLAMGDPAGAVAAAEASRGILLADQLDLRTPDGLAPPRPDELTRAATGGTVVLLNPGVTRHDAVVITAGAPPRTVELPEQALLPHRWAEDLIDATQAGPSLAGTLRRQRVVGDTLRWLWDDVVGPVLAALPDSTEPHRIWWLPVGYLAALPLHAAGYPGEPGALDRAVSSYVPTLRSLDQARQRPAATARRQLTVDLSHTPAQPDIPGTAAEAAQLHARHPDGPRLSNEDATVAGVLTGLADCTWAHFACHANADLAAPSRGGLRLHDRVLRLPEISELRLAHAELAYLSACSTARVGWRHTNEAIHLASAFQLAGFRHVIASLWPLADEIAAAAAREFYERLPAEPDANAAAATLRAVTLHLRESYPDRPDLWASLVHSGP